MDKKKTGKFLEFLRREKGLIREAMVDGFREQFEVEITPETIGRWERGENFPDLYSLKELAKFFNVSIDEIYNGERENIENFQEKYFLCNNDWLAKCTGEEINLWEIAQKQKLEIEKTFNKFLKKLVNKTITTSEEKEFDFICLNFYNVNEEKILKEMKIKIRKLCAKMSSGGMEEERYWEALKEFKYKYKLQFYYDICDAVLCASDIIEQRISNTSNVEKDILLAFIQKNAFYDPHGAVGAKQFFKVYGIEYDIEKLTKEMIRVLIRNGACIHRDLLGYSSQNQVKRNILTVLEQGYKQYRKDIVVAVQNKEGYTYHLVENTPKNRIMLDWNQRCDCPIDEDMLDVLEQKLQHGEIEFVEEKTSWQGIGEISFEDTYSAEELEEVIENINQRVSQQTYQEYNDGRMRNATISLLSELDDLSLAQIREKYFNKEAYNVE